MWRRIITSPTISAQQNGFAFSCFFLTILKVQITINALSRMKRKGNHLRQCWFHVCLSQQYLQFSCNLCRTQNTINQNEMNYDCGKLTNSAFLFCRVRRFCFSSIQPLHLLIYNNKPCLLLPSYILFSSPPVSSPIATSFRSAPKTKVV